MRLHLRRRLSALALVPRSIGELVRRDLSRVLAYAKPAAAARVAAREAKEEVARVPVHLG